MFFTRATVARTLPFAVYTMFISLNNALAEGIVDIKPYVGVNTTYDDNIFRYSGPQQAKAATGSTAMSDTYVSAEAGVNVNLRLSRQLVSISAGINKNQFSRFTQLDNVGKSYGLAWSWRLGNDLSGEIGASENSAISSFNEFTNKTRNIRTAKRQFVSANWQFQPSWTARVNAEQTQSENGNKAFNNLDRESDVFGAGIRYDNPSNTQLSLDYRITNSIYPNRAGTIFSQLGNESTQEEWIAAAAWQPTGKTRMSVNVSQVSLDYKNTSRQGFSGLSEIFSLDYLFSAKTSLNLSAYQQISANDDLVSSYVQSTGFTISPTYNFSEKLNFKASFGLVSRDSLGNAGLVASNVESRLDKYKNASISLSYLPTDKSLVQVTYLGERRRTNIVDQDYDFNTFNMYLRYNF